MGAIWFSRAQLLGSVSEMVGYKSGVALDTSQIVDLSPEHYQDYFVGEMDNAVRVRSEEFEEIIAGLLHGLGNIDSPSIAPGRIKMFHRLKEKPEELKLYFLLVDAMSDRLASLLSAGGIQPPNHDGDGGVYQRISRPAMMMGSERILRFDRKEFAQFAYTRFGETGYSLAVAMIDDFNADIHRNPWLGYREQQFDDIVALTELFRSESLTTSTGTFLDQRFIDYLHANEPDVSKMNWRKFEGLVGEYFTREGYIIELGPGRGDDGIDARVWPKERAPGDPAAIVVQCKRQKEAISKVVVKSLWADILAERAHSGLIVTTSKLSPGAQKTCKAREYPIEVADGKSVSRWLEAMKSPKAGMFLAE
jgi:restriction system protein